MILVINTTESKKIRIGLGKPSNILYFEYDTKDQSNDILLLIKNLLKKHKVKLEDLKVICVYIGQGSFTGVRVGVTVANSLAWSLNIPVIGFKGEVNQGDICKLKSEKFTKIALPYYSRQAKL